MNSTAKVMMAAAAAAILYGCGGGGGDSSSYAPDSHVLPAGRATLAFTAISTAQLDSSISGIDMTVFLPQGMSVSTENTGSSQIATGSVLPGAALSGTNLAYGRYSSPIRKATLTMATTSNAYRSGEFLRLTCNVDTNTSISVAAVKALNNPVALIKAVGYDPGTSSTTVLTGKVRVNLNVVP